MADIIDRAALECHYYLTEQIRKACQGVAHANPKQDCSDCGEPIGTRRKAALPSAGRCLLCQQAFETRQEVK